MKRFLIIIMLTAILSMRADVQEKTIFSLDNKKVSGDTISSSSKDLNDKEFLVPDYLDDSFDMASRMETTETLVNEAASFFSQEVLSEALRSFESDPRWHKGGFSLFVFADDGTCYFHGKMLEVLWHNFKNGNTKNCHLAGSASDQDFITDMLQAGEKGRWTAYQWNNANKYAFVKVVKSASSDRKYIIGAGFYPKSHAFELQQMIKKAVNYAKREGAQELFKHINNPRGEFRQGDLYLWAYDLQGFAFAHGRNFAMVGQDRLHWKDYYGKERNKIIIDIAQGKGNGWIEYYEKGGIRKIAYFSTFNDSRTGKTFIVGGGYYPTLDGNVIRNFVRRGVNYLQANGVDLAVSNFSSHASEFVQGPLALFMYDMEGTMLADGENPIFIGQSLINARDQEGRYIVRSIIDLAKTSGQGWLTFLLDDEYKSLYIQKVEVPDGTFIIGSGYWPSTKDFIAESLAKKAANHLENNPLGNSLAEFIDLNPNFLLGDLFVSVYSSEGICLAHGYDKGRIWFDEKTVRDDKGYPYIDRLIATARRGGGWIDYEQYGATKHHYVCLVEKEMRESAPSHRGLKKRDIEKTVRQGNVVKQVSLAPRQKQEFIVSVSYFK